MTTPTTDPSPIVLRLAQRWSSGELLFIGQIAALSRWAAGALADIEPRARVEALTKALGLGAPDARELCKLAGMATGAS